MKSPASIRSTSRPGPMKKFWSSGMFLPILHSEDGYGLTYGARFALSIVSDRAAASPCR